MANKKKKNANQNAGNTAAVSDARDQKESAEASDVASSSKSASESKGSKKEKGSGKEVVKSQARATDPKKANKKPNIFQRFIEYIKQVRLEIKRTTWPTKSEVLNLTIIVLVALLFFGVIIFILDFVMVELLNIYSNFAPDATTPDVADIAGAAGGEG